MANYTLDPNMGFPNPTPTVDPGPDYATNLQTSLTTIGAHTHSPGSGLQITPNGLNINADLPINGNNLTLVKTVNFQSQSASLSGIAPNLGCVYVAGADLYYNDENGNVVQITSGGSVNAGAGSITGLPSGTASASFSGGVFTWRSATSTPANMNFGSAVLGNNNTNGFGLTLSPPSLASSYTITLPTLPASPSFLQVDTSGNITASIAISGGITNTNIADNTITYPKLSSSSFNSPALLASVGVTQQFTSSGSYTVPAGVTQLYIVACGGGGGGGGGGKQAPSGGSGGLSGGGGGAGSPVWQGFVPVTAGNTYTVTIGAGGSAGSAGGGGGGSGAFGNGGNGGQGGTTSFGSLMAIPGGLAGTGGTISPSTVSSTTGAAGSGGTGRGVCGQRGSTATISASGAGAVSFFSDTWDGNGGNGAYNGGNSGGFGGGGGGSIGVGQHGAPSGSVGVGGGGGGGNGGAGLNVAGAGGAGGVGQLTIYIV